MFKQNTLKVIVASSLLASAVSAFAQENVTSTATVTVSNAFDFVETQPITFGTITAIGFVANDATVAGDIVANVIIPATGGVASATTTGATSDTDAGDRDSSIQILTPGQRGLYDISNAAPFTDLTVTLPSAPVTLTALSAPGGNGTFTMDNFTAVNTDGNTTVTTQITTDGSGVAQLGLGATLSTPAPSPGASLTYTDGVYEGSYSITVSY